MKNNNDLVVIELDRPRVLRYGHKALKRLVAITGKSLEEIEAAGFSDLEIVEKIVYCGLLSDAKENGENLQLEQMEDLLDEAPNYAHIIERTSIAFRATFQLEGNQGEPAAQ